MAGRLGVIIPLSNMFELRQSGASIEISEVGEKVVVVGSQRAKSKEYIYTAHSQIHNIIRVYTYNHMEVPSGGE